MKDDENDDDDDEKRGEGRESDENIVVVFVVVVVEQAKIMSFFCRLLVSYVFFVYKFVRVRFRCVACVCAFSRNTRAQTYRYENKNAKTMRRYEAMRV